MSTILAEVDITKKIEKPQLFLCRPNGQSVSILSESFDISQTIKLGSVNELQFTLPVFIELNHKLQRNPHVDIVRERYLIKVKKGMHHEIYIINQISDVSDDSQDVKQVHCFSLQYELTDKLIRNYEVTSYSPLQVLNDALSETLWAIEYIEPEFLTAYRSFSVSSKNVLEFLNEIAITFNGLLIYNTLLRTISLYNPDNVGQNKGLRFSYGNLIKTIEKTVNTDNFATRLKVFGENDLTIASVNVTGENFIENYSNFMTLDFMSQSLIDAIVSYTALLEANEGNHSVLLSQLTAKQEILTTKETELKDLEGQILIIQDSLEIAIQTEQSTISGLTTQRDNKQTEIDAKKLEINAVNVENTNITNQMIALRNTLSVQNNFTSEQIIERNSFEITKELTNSNYTDAQSLYDFALKEFDKICKPEISIKIEIANLLEILEQQHNWGKLNLADTCMIYYPRLNINIKAKIIEMVFDYSEGTVALSIANVQQILTDQQKFLQSLYGAISTSTTMDMSKYKYQSAYTKATEIEEIINNTWNAVTRSIVAGVNESVTIDGRGITVVSPDDPMGVVRINHANIGVSADGGNTYKNALTKSGVVAERVFGKLGAFCTLKADQIVLGDLGETLSDEIIQVGSRNLLTQSQTSIVGVNNWGLDFPSSGTIQTLVIDNQNTVVITGNGAGTIYDCWKIIHTFLSKPLTSNQQYIFSIDVKTTKAFAKWSIFLKKGSQYSEYPVDIPNTNGEWKRISLTFTPILTDDYLNFAIQLFGIASGDVFYFRNLQIETGNKATDWTPAVEDVDASIANSIQPNKNYNGTYISQDGIKVKNASSQDVVQMGEFSTGLYGLKASHADGSYTQLTANGLERLVAGESKPYQYETHLQEGTTMHPTGYGESKPTSFSDPTPTYFTNGKYIQLPNRFKGKAFKAFIVYRSGEMAHVGSTSASSPILKINSIDYTNAIIHVLGYNTSYWYRASDGVTYWDYQDENISYFDSSESLRKTTGFEFTIIITL